MKNRILCLVGILLPATGLGSAQAIAIRAGHLIDPETGSIAVNQLILVEAGKFSGVGPNLSIPEGAEVIDLTEYYVSPGLVDAHNHLALTYKKEPENNTYYLTSVLDSTAIRAIQAVSNGITMMNAGFTVVRDLGNAANYADTALRVAIEQGWIPGPTVINSGIIIGGMGGQFYPVPERASLVYPEYLDADTPDEIVKAVRRNILYGAKVIKIMVDAKPYGYTVDEMKLFVSEAAKSGLKVAGHVQTHAGAMRAIEAGIWSIEHSIALDDEAHKQMAQKGIWRVGTESPLTTYYSSNEARFQKQEDGMKNAYANRVKMAFSTDADYYIPGHDARRDRDRFSEELEGGGDSGARDFENHDRERLQSLRHLRQARPDQDRLSGGPDRRASQSLAGDRRVARCALRDERRRGVQARRRDDPGEVFPQRAGEWLACSLSAIPFSL